MGSSLKLSEAKQLNLSYGLYNRESIFDGFPYDHYPTTNSNLQISYSPKKHLGISLHHSRNNFPSDEWWPPPNKYFIHSAHQTGFDIGGYYDLKFQLRRPKKRLPPNLARYNKLLFDFYSGFSLGQYKNQEVAENSLPILNYRLLTIHSRKIYLQSGLHWIGRFVHLSGMLRLGQVKYNKASLSGNAQRWEFDLLSDILAKQKSRFFGYSAKIELNFKGIGIYGETTREKVISFDDYYNPYELATIGITINLQQLNQNFFKKK